MAPQFRYLICSILTFFCCLDYCFSQGQKVDSIAKISVNNAVSFYRSALGENLRYVNGNTYYTYGANVGGSAILGDSSFTVGTITYEGIEYPDVQLMYDAYIDKLVSFTNTGAFSITTDKVDGFTLGSRKFMNLRKIESKKPLNTGYYELLYSGEHSIYAKHFRELKFSLNKEVPNFFNPKTMLYLNKQGVFHPIDKLSDLLKLLENKKNEITAYLKENKLRYDKNPGSVAVEILKFYENTSL